MKITKNIKVKDVLDLFKADPDYCIIVDGDSYRFITEE